MNRENENANTPDVDDGSTFDPHPFTGDKPVTSSQRADDLAAEADQGTDASTGQPRTETPRTQTTRGDTYPDATREETYGGAARGEMYAGADRGTEYAGASRTAGGVPELGPLFDGTLASDFQQQWGHIQSGFVEDPQGAVRLAKDLTDSIVTSLARALEERRHALDDSARNGDTEQLRLVLRQYREVLEEVTSL
jgi:hypothetical protein